MKVIRIVKLRIYFYNTLKYYALLKYNHNFIIIYYYTPSI